MNVVKNVFAVAIAMAAIAGGSAYAKDTTTTVPACCAKGNCCAAGACCTMPGCCKADKSCCDPAKGVCTSACGCLTKGCCATPTRAAAKGANHAPKAQKTVAKVAACCVKK